ncbi:MAG: hypothetical protein OXK21_02240 [Chloroflexota bacterium]|nr:hypothetical protein [Chloroflexota bacterium]
MTDRKRFSLEKSVRSQSCSVPESGRAVPAMQLSVVLLPLPDGPKTAVMPAVMEASSSRVKSG